MRSIFIASITCAVLAACSSSEGTPEAAPIPNDGGTGSSADARATTTTQAPAPPAPEEKILTDPPAFACTPAPRPTLLSQTCLYADIAKKEIAPDLVAYTPAHQLWSDGERKRRFLRLPRGAKIDTANMDAWQLPVGAQLFKEFATKDGTLLETRLIQRVGSGTAESDFIVLAFVWKSDGSDATASPNGQANVSGSEHDVPGTRQCWECHSGEPGHVLGVSAIQLSTATGVSVAMLARAGRLSAAPAEGGYPLPGNAVESAALGYLHANCGHCHRQGGAAFRERIDMVLHLEVANRNVTDTGPYKTAVNVDTQGFFGRGKRIAPKAPDESAVYTRMSTRGRGQMPPLGTEETDPTGLAAIAAWINAL